MTTQSLPRCGKELVGVLACRCGKSRMVHVHKRPYVLRCLACRQHYVARVSPGRDILYWVRYDANELRAKVHGAIIAVMINNGYRTEFGERAAAAIAESMEQKPRRMMALPPHEKGRDDGTE